jgi:hypothetical protein
MYVLGVHFGENFMECFVSSFWGRTSWNVCFGSSFWRELHGMFCEFILGENLMYVLGVHFGENFMECFAL